MSRRKHGTEEMSSLSGEVPGSDLDRGERNDLAPGADNDFREVDPPQADQVANASQEQQGAGNGVANDSQVGAVGPEQDRGLAEQGDGTALFKDLGRMHSEEQAPQVPTGNHTEKAETKRMNFRRVASGRVTRILDNLRLLNHCANTSTYEWDQTQHDKIFGAIKDLTKEVEAAFTKAKAPRIKYADRKQMRFEV
jgi:hypothetical protein